MDIVKLLTSRSVGHSDAITTISVSEYKDIIIRTFHFCSITDIYLHIHHMLLLIATLNHKHTI